MKFIVEIRDYQAGSGSGEDELHATDIEDAVMGKLDQLGDDGTVIVEAA